MRLFKKKSLNDILKIEDREEKIQEVYDYLSKKSHYGKNIEYLNEYEKDLFFCMAFQDEMNEGGFEQFFCSDVANDMGLVYQSLLHLNANDLANLLKEAMDIFPNGIVPIKQGERENLLELLLNDGNIFQELDEQYCPMKIENIHEYLEKMIENKE